MVTENRSLSRGAGHWGAWAFFNAWYCKMDLGVTVKSDSALRCQRSSWQMALFGEEEFLMQQCVTLSDLSFKNILLALLKYPLRGWFMEKMDRSSHYLQRDLLLGIRCRWDGSFWFIVLGGREMGRASPYRALNIDFTSLLPLIFIWRMENWSICFKPSR